MGRRGRDRLRAAGTVVAIALAMTGLRLRIVVEVMPLPFALVADNVTVTDSGARALNAVSAALGRLIVNVNARFSCAEPCLPGARTSCGVFFRVSA